MKGKWKLIVLVFILGVLCPNLLLAVVSKRKTAQPVETAEPPTVAQQELPDKEQTMAVLDKSGAVRQISMDAYLTAVVLCEMPAEFEMEALKAQAVVARTYALRRQNTGGKHASAAVCMEPSCCQGYKPIEEYLLEGGKTKDVEKIEKAVAETRNMVLTYNGELIEATYFSCSGGSTEDAAAVWGVSYPYLQVVLSPGEEKIKNDRKEVYFTKLIFEDRLSLSLSEDPKTWFGAVTYTLRSMLELNSTVLTAETDDGVVITTWGKGHRVGMSQAGAQAMALRGYGFETILTYNYPGAVIDKLENLG